jgi:transposase-like protein
MGQTSPSYTAESKKKTVELYNSKKPTYAAVAKNLRTGPGALSGWVRPACSSEEETAT